MKFSIGIPAYNQGHYLRETLESTLNQDQPFDEIVVSNNHSTDSTAAVIAEVQAKYPGRIRAVMPPEHLSMGANWNFVISQMQGEWISLLSSDDLALPNFVTSMRRAIGLSDNAALAHAAWRDIDENGKTMGDHHLLTIAPVTKPPKTLYELRFGPKGSFAAFALRRDIWERVGGFPDKTFILGGDWAMWLMATALGDMVYVDDIVSAYRYGHQTDVHRKRHHIHMRELFQQYQVTMPRAMELGGFEMPAWVATASRKRFREALIQTSREYTLAERPQLIESFRPWSEAVGEQKLFRRFEQGEVLRRSPRDALRPIAREWVVKLRRLRS